jgi:hypothetical protein
MVAIGANELSICKSLIDAKAAVNHSSDAKDSALSLAGTLFTNKTHIHFVACRLTVVYGCMFGGGIAFKGLEAIALLLLKAGANPNHIDRVSLYTIVLTSI